MIICECFSRLNVTYKLICVVRVSSRWRDYLQDHMPISVHRDRSLDCSFDYSVVVHAPLMVSDSKSWVWMDRVTEEADWSGVALV